MKRPQHIVLLFCAALLCAACATKHEPSPQRQLQFLDSQLFDEKLHRSLAARLPEVTVEFLGSDPTVNNLPQRLDRWLTVIMKEGEDRIQVRVDPRYTAPKSLVGAGIMLALKAYGVVTDWLFYAPAQEYDALILHEPGTGRLTRLIFTRRADA